VPEAPTKSEVKSGSKIIALLLKYKEKYYPEPPAPPARAQVETDSCKESR
jgi:hypothetical protein